MKKLIIGIMNLIFVPVLAYAFNVYSENTCGSFSCGCAEKLIFQKGETVYVEFSIDYQDWTKECFHLHGTYHLIYPDGTDKWFKPHVNCNGCNYEGCWGEGTYPGCWGIGFTGMQQTGKYKIEGIIDNVETGESDSFVGINALEFWVETYCTDECSPSGSEEYRCNGDIREKRTCGDHDNDGCLEWSSWSTVEDCNSRNYYSACVWSCFDSDTKRCSRNYYDYTCSNSGQSCTLASTTDASYNEDCPAGYQCIDGDCVAGRVAGIITLIFQGALSFLRELGL